jgi:hypothetical protein
VVSTLPGGGVTISNGVAEQGDHNHFEFVATTISCADAGAGTPTGTFDVAAAGGTDGPTSLVDGVHGERLDAGWSHGNCYAPDCVVGKKGVDDLYAGAAMNAGVNPLGPNRNLGEILAAPGGHSTSNWLKFCRGTYDDNGVPPVEHKCFPSTGGGNVIAWGEIVFAGFGPVCFWADLGLTPDGGVNTTEPVPKLNTAQVNGAAVTWLKGGGTCHGTKK